MSNISSFSSSSSPLSLPFGVALGRGLIFRLPSFVGVELMNAEGWPSIKESVEFTPCHCGELLMGATKMERARNVHVAFGKFEQDACQQENAF